MSTLEHPVALTCLLLLPFAVWDALMFELRRRGDRCPSRRRRILRHFSEEDIAIGREQLLRHNRLVPLSRALFYGGFLLLLPAGLGATLEAWALGVASGSWLVGLPLFLGALLLGWTVLSAPLDAYREFVILRQAGLSTTTARLWLIDQLKGLVLGWILVSLLALPVVALIRALPLWWPLPATAAVLGFSAFLIWVSPWLISPLFNRFEPLADEELVRRVTELAQRAGLPVRRVYVMDASRRSTALNAYFTGLGSSRRVVLYDTLVDACDGDEVLSVVAHELGHWRGRHIAKSFLLQAGGTISGFFILSQMLHSEVARTMLGLPGPSSLVLLPALPLLLALAGKLVGPVGATLSRRFERYADRTAFSLTDDPAAFVRLEVLLVRRAKADLLQPPLIHRMYASHPLPEERIAAAEAFGGGGAQQGFAAK